MKKRENKDRFFFLVCMYYHYIVICMEKKHHNGERAEGTKEKLQCVKTKVNMNEPFVYCRLSFRVSLGFARSRTWKHRIRIYYLTKILGYFYQLIFDRAAKQTI